MRTVTELSESQFFIRLNEKVLRIVDYIIMKIDFSYFCY